MDKTIFRFKVNYRIFLRLILHIFSEIIQLYNYYYKYNYYYIISINYKNRAPNHNYFIMQL